MFPLQLGPVSPAWLPARGGGDSAVPSEHLWDVYREFDSMCGCSNVPEVIGFHQQTMDSPEVSTPTLEETARSP